MTEEVKKPKEKRTSELLNDIKESLSSDEVTLGKFMQKFGERGFGIAILLFTMPNLIPAGIPIISTICGLPIMIFAIQLALGMQRLKLPETVAKRKFRENLFDKVIKLSTPPLKAVEVFVKPRWAFFTSDFFEKICGVAIFVMAFILFLPIPFANFIPAVCIAIIALGLLERDGLMVFLGLVASVFTAWGLSFAVHKVIMIAWQWIVA